MKAQAKNCYYAKLSQYYPNQAIICHKSVGITLSTIQKSHLTEQE